MRCRLCRYMWGINAVQVYVGEYSNVRCVGVCGGLIICRMCSYMWWINEM